MEGSQPLPASIQPSFLPNKDALWAVLAMATFATTLRAAYHLLRDIPAMIFKLSTFHVLSTSSYYLAVALLDALIIWVVLVVVSMILPARWLRNHFKLQGSIIAPCLAFWIFLIVRQTVVLSSLTMMVLVTAGIIALLIALTYGLTRLRWQKQATMVLDRLLILAYLYLGLDLLGLMIVIGRNLWSLLT